MQAAPSPSQASTEAAIGFVLVTYKNPEQLLRLVHTLNRVYGDPPIAIHQDFGQCDPGAARFPANAVFVRPHATTGWGTFGVCGVPIDPGWVTGDDARHHVAASNEQPPARADPAGRL